MPQNIEIKVACCAGDLAAIAARLEQRDLSALMRIAQVDTYFRVDHGRFKLRQITSERGDSAELIQYDRPNSNGPRLSTYRRARVAPDQAEHLICMLSAALGELITVSKQRTVAIWRSTRIHLDVVESLGQFVELETVLAGQDVADAQREFDAVVKWLDLGALTSIPGSYSDLLGMERQHL